MPLDDDAYRLRDRAESFGAVAAAYDRYRPSYPAELVEELLVTGPGTALDVGCGTGKAGRLLAERGVHVLGVEIDAKMAEVARTHGLEVEVAPFEDWDDAGRRFDLVISAQAWHWVDPVRAVPKVARLLVPPGRLVAFWNYDDLDPDVARAVNDVYRRLEPQLGAGTLPRGYRHSEQPYLHRIEETGVFTDLTTRTYAWEREDPVEQWLGQLGTHSDHLLLPAQRFADLRTALGEVLTSFGPTVHVRGGTYAILAAP